MLHEKWLRLLREHGGPRYRVEAVGSVPDVIHLDGAPFMTPLPAMFDYDLRIRSMDEAGVDVAIVSLTCPNVYWGGPGISLEAARILNDDMALAERTHPGRIRWLASLPWQYPSLAVSELDRARALGAVGVMVLGNIDGRSLTDPCFSDA